MAAHGGQPKPSFSATATATSTSEKKQQEQQHKDALPSLPSLFEAAEKFLRRLGYSRDLPEAAMKESLLSGLVRSTLKVDVVERGRVVFSLTVIPQLTNPYNTLHGGVVAVVAEEVALACLRTVAGEKEFFLGESAVSCLSAARLNVELDVEGRIIRQGRSIIVASVELRIKKTQQLAYIARFTFYNMPFAKL